MFSHFVRRGDVEALRRLHPHWIEIDYIDRDLLISARYGYWDVFQLLVEERGRHHSNWEEVLASSMMLAIMGRHVDFVRCLLEMEHFQVNSNIFNWNTALHFAVWSGCIEIMELLISSGADLDMRNFDGVRPLDLAIIQNDEAATRLLIRHGVDVNGKAHPETVQEESMLLSEAKEDFDHCQLVSRTRS